MDDLNTITGLRIRYLPDKITVGAVTTEGTVALKWFKNNLNELRRRIKIEFNDWPNVEFSVLYNGAIYMVTFTRATVE
jgi:hypothetical protein